MGRSVMPFMMGVGSIGGICEDRSISLEHARCARRDMLPRTKQTTKLRLWTGDLVAAGADLPLRKEELRHSHR